MKKPVDYIALTVQVLWGVGIYGALNDIYSLAHGLAGGFVGAIIGFAISYVLQGKRLFVRIAGGIISIGALVLIIVLISNTKDASIRSKVIGSWEVEEWHENRGFSSITFETDSAYIIHHPDSLPISYHYTISNQILTTATENLEGLDWEYPVVDVTSSRLRLKDGPDEVVLHRIN